MEGAGFALQVPELIREELIEAFAKQFNYQDQIPTSLEPAAGGGRGMMKNPMSKEEFMLDLVKRNLMQILMDVRTEAYKNAQRKALDLVFGYDGRPN